MGLERYLSTPGAILIAGAVIGLGAYLGLRSRDQIHSSSAPAPHSTAPVTAASAPVLPGTVDLAEVVRLGSAALEKHRGLVLDACVKNALAGTPSPTIKLTFNVTFDASGQQIGRGVIEDRTTRQPEMTQCVQSTLPPLTIPGQGAVVAVDLPWTLP